MRYFQGDERVSHLHPFWDFLRIGRLNAIYVTQKLCLPAPYLGLRITRKFQDLPFGSRLRETLAELFVREPGSTPRIAASVGLGLFWGVAPVWGFQILLCLLTAHVLRLSKTVAVVASHISVPIMIPPILYASLVVGRLALGVPDQVPSAVSLEIAQADLPVWVVGSLLLGAGLAGVGALVTLVGVGLARRLRGAVRAEPPAA